MAVVKAAVFDKLQVYLCESRRVMAACAARDVIQEIKEMAQDKECINIMFAAAPSQNEFLEYLSKDDSIPWDKINVFHMDEYLGNHMFVDYLKEKLFDKVRPRKMFLIDGCCLDAQEECRRYTEILKDMKMDIVCMGIGENGHIAFNDPYMADFCDEETAKVVKLDEKCRKQQVNDGCFSSVEEVPVYAITITVPALVRTEKIYCIVPDSAKSEAVYQTLKGKISEECPATILRTLDYASLYIDGDSGRKVKDDEKWEMEEKL